jgi:phenylalanyl-tRNA synthetase beta subunit
VKVQDVYEGEESATLTLRFAFSASDRTLTKQELAPAMEAIAKAYEAYGLKAQV